MSMDGDVECSSFSDQTLDEVLRRTDPLVSPLDYAKLRAERERRHGSPELPPPAVLFPAEFRGEGGEYFRIWIVNLLLTLLTLGIYSAWAKVRKQRYLYSNTSVAGSAFGYHADPLKILRGRLIAAALFGLYFIATRYSLWTTALAFLVLGTVWPWLIVRSRMFALRMTSWRGLRLSFRRDYQGAYTVFLGWMLLAALTLGVLYPRAMWERYRYLVSRSSFGQSPFNSTPRLKRFYITALAAIGLWLGWMVGFIIMIVIATAVAKDSGLSSDHLAMLILIVMGLCYLLLFSILRAYTQSRYLNEVLGTTQLGSVRLKCRISATQLLGLYVSNGLGIIFTLGLYTPWAEIRVARYRMQCLQFEFAGSPEQFVAAAEAPGVGAAGEEISEFFDLDFGL